MESRKDRLYFRRIYVYKGIVRIVIDVKDKYLCPVAEYGTIFKEPRFAFVGDVVSDSPYLNTDVTDYPFGSGGAVTYIPRNSKEW